MVIDSNRLTAAEIDAFAAFKDTWSDPYLMGELGTTLSCTEAEALAGVMEVLGMDETAEELIQAHGYGDCGDWDQHHDIYLQRKEDT